MHIVFANQWFPPESGWGGVAVYNRTMALALERIGHNVSVVAARTDPAIPPFQLLEGVRIHRLLVRDPYRLRRMPGLGRYIRPLQQLAYSRRVAAQVRQIAIQESVDIVEFADVNAEGFFYARRPESAVVVRCHTPTFVLRRYYSPAEMSFDTRIISWCERETIRCAHALSAPSLDMAQVIGRECGLPIHRIDVVPNPLPVDDYKPTIAGESNGRVTVLHVGRLERAKGIETLAEAIPLVLRENPNVRFALLGEDGPAVGDKSPRAVLESYLTESNAISNVQFIGGVDHPGLLEWYRDCDICVVPSMLYESFSYTCAQAMAAGKPVIASRIGGIPETIGDCANGILVTPGNASELAEAILALAHDRELRQKLGRAAQERAACHFDMSKVAEQMLSIYQQAIEKFGQRHT